MNGLSYQRLEKITTIEPHFRGNKDRFPLGQRRQNNKYFLVRDENGQKVFDIVYGTHWKRHELTKDDWTARGGEDGKGNYAYTQYDNKGQATGEKEYGRYEPAPNVMGTVRPDETFQFTKEIYHQGDRCFLSQFKIGRAHV